MLTLEKNNLLEKEIDLNVIKHYEKERLIINSIDSKLSYLEKKSKNIYNGLYYRRKKTL